MIGKADEIGEPVYDDGKDGDVLYSDGHETMVIRKSLLAPKGDVITLISLCF